MSVIFHSYSEDDTRRVASTLAKNAKAGDTFCLHGELGAGKTTFAQGFIGGHVTSPTFVLMNEYERGDVRVYHFDLYRITEDDLEGIGFTDCLSSGVCLIEWAERAGGQIPDGAARVRIRADAAKGDSYREITVS